MSNLAQQLKQIKPGEIGLDHGSITFTNDNKFKYVITSGFYNGYPIVTDNLYGALVTLFTEIKEYIDDLYNDKSLDQEHRDDLIYDAMYLIINSKEIELEEYDLECNDEPLLCVGLPIRDICGSNFGSGLYVAE